MSDKHARVTHLEGMTFKAEANGREMTVSDDGNGMGPMDLALVALAACTAMDVVLILQKARQPFSALSVTAHGERAADHPRRYTRVKLIYEIVGKDVKLSAAERAAQLSAERYCSVSATFEGNTEIQTIVNVVAATDSET